MPGQDKANRSGPVASSRLALSFASIALPYQLSVALQERFAPGSIAGPLLMLAAFAACPLAAWLILRHPPFAAFGLGLRSNWWRLLAAMMATAAMAKLATIAAGLALGMAIPADPDPLPGAAMLGILLLTTFIPSITEDILTRGIPMLSRLFERGLLPFAATSALLYTLNHVWRFDWGPSEQVRLLCMGLAYAAACWRWRSLWAAVGLHWGWNLANALANSIWPVEWLSESAMRYSGALVHVAIFAGIALWPRSSDPAADSPTVPPARA